MKSKKMKSLFYRIILLLCFISIAKNSYSNDKKTLLLLIENVNQKKLEIVIETQDTTIVHKLGKNKKTHSYILLNLDSDSFYFKITLKKKYWFKGELCDEREIGDKIFNEAMCSKTNRFMSNLFFHKSINKRNKSFGRIFLRSCCEGGYIEIGNWFKSCKP